VEEHEYIHVLVDEQEDVNELEIPKLRYRRRYHSLDHGIVDDSISRVNTC